jgi:hypothetical protein
MTWTYEQINDCLAKAGVRSPGVTVEEPERIVAALLLDCQARCQELVREVLIANDKLERANWQAVNAKLTAERDAAFALVRKLEIHIRSVGLPDPPP